jgi:hypothetical protein
MDMDRRPESPTPSVPLFSIGDPISIRQDHRMAVWFEQNYGLPVQRTDLATVGHISDRIWMVPVSQTTLNAIRPATIGSWLYRLEEDPFGVFWPEAMLGCVAESHNLVL